VKRRWLPHLILDEPQQISIGKSAEIVILIQILDHEVKAANSQCNCKSCPQPVAYFVLCLPDDSERDFDTDFPDASKARVDELRSLFVRVQGRRKRDGGLFDHAVRDVASLGEDRTEADTREDVHVISLSRLA
jgi:hypothetical protein